MKIDRRNLFVDVPGVGFTIRDLALKFAHAATTCASWTPSTSRDLPEWGSHPQASARLQTVSAANIGSSQRRRARGAG